MKDTVRRNLSNPSGAGLGLGWHQSELGRVMVWDVMEGERNKTDFNSTSAENKFSFLVDVNENEIYVS